MIFGFHSFQQVDFKKSDYFLQKKLLAVENALFLQQKPQYVVQKQKILCHNCVCTLCAP